ncbi:unnamed protein product [Bursaphelenchus okinawaensis]|uniref:CNNM transmembrane domain-containing protein n=1 Tax=Bursaphelenchus okinawaensis TaxID=465554 RepID=A0A811LTB7_9BILA|nr:unnamed protein product [Bursaphelenchus okinawaensis]CAG9127836.1 unnamed protein product [Bursaphelenchus okinawaensis]
MAKLSIGQELKNVILVEFRLSTVFVLFLILGTVNSDKDNRTNNHTDQLKEVILRSFIEKKPDLSGLRVESDKPAGEAFLGYSPRGVTIVRPNLLLRVVLFGRSLDEIDVVGFTPSSTCRNVISNVSQADFFVQTDKRIIFEYTFLQLPDSTSLYQFCWKQKNRQNSDGIDVELPYVAVNELHTSISITVPLREYYFPLPFQIVLMIVLLVLSGLFSGLNLGLMALTPQELMLISKSGSDKERAFAEIVLPVRLAGNQLLCSLLIGNVLVNSAISILFDDLTSGYIALIVSSAGIVVFGEICPQAVCVKKGLEVGARTIWVTKFFMAITLPIAYPISKILDKILGLEGVSYDRRRLMEMIKMTTRYEESMADELKIAVGAMEINDKTVTEVMTKIDDVFMLPDTTVLNTKTVAEVLRMGYTRIPVYCSDRNNVVALLFVKDLALLNPDDNFTIKTVCSYHEHALRFVMEETPLRVMLEEFKKGDYHLAMVQRVIQIDDQDPGYELTGVVTLEDIVEEILQEEIVDETDVIIDNVNKTRRRKTIMHDYTNCFMDTDAEACLISIQMQVVTVQWLSTNHKVFHECYIGKNVLEKVIRQNVHKIELIHLKDNMNILPPNARLYLKKEPSDKFILILEGRVAVTIGETNMTFEAGPWHCFGKELLDVLHDDINKNKLMDNCHSSPKVSTVFNDVEMKRLMFIPDYTVVIKDQCTYLEVTPQTYLLAFKSTLITRNRNEFMEKHPSDFDDIHLHKTTSESVLKKCNNNSTPATPAARIKKSGTGAKLSMGNERSFDGLK